MSHIMGLVFFSIFSVDSVRCPEYGRNFELTFLYLFVCSPSLCVNRVFVAMFFVYDFILALCDWTVYSLFVLFVYRVFVIVDD